MVAVSKVRARRQGARAREGGRASERGAGTAASARLSVCILCSKCTCTGGGEVCAGFVPADDVGWGLTGPRSCVAFTHIIIKPYYTSGTYEMAPVGHGRVIQIGVEPKKRSHTVSETHHTCLTRHPSRRASEVSNARDSRVRTRYVAAAAHLKLYLTSASSESRRPCNAAGAARTNGRVDPKNKG